MGVKNYLIEGVSGAGKTAVCRELQRRGHHAINGDRELAYLGDSETGKPTDGLAHEPSAIFRSEPQDSPHFSNWPKYIREERLLVQQLREALHQRAQPLFTHGGD
jgi:hypothetical protein